MDREDVKNYFLCLDVFRVLHNHCCLDSMHYLLQLFFQNLEIFISEIVPFYSWRVIQGFLQIAEYIYLHDKSATIAKFWSNPTLLTTSITLKNQAAHSFYKVSFPFCFFSIISSLFQVGFFGKNFFKALKLTIWVIFSTNMNLHQERQMKKNEKCEEFVISLRLPRRGHYKYFHAHLASASYYHIWVCFTEIRQCFVLW